MIQYVKQEKSQFWDKGGGNTPHAETIGSGTAMVLRDGLAWKTTWTRPNAKSGTTFTLRDGTPLPFKPGQLWIVLLDKKRSATHHAADEAEGRQAAPVGDGSHHRAGADHRCASDCRPAVRPVRGRVPRHPLGIPEAPRRRVPPLARTSDREHAVTYVTWTLT